MSNQKQAGAGVFRKSASIKLRFTEESLVQLFIKNWINLFWFIQTIQFFFSTGNEHSCKLHKFVNIKLENIKKALLWTASLTSSTHFHAFCHIASAHSKKDNKYILLPFDSAQEIKRQNSNEKKMKILPAILGERKQKISINFENFSISFYGFDSFMMYLSCQKRWFFALRFFDSNSTLALTVRCEVRFRGTYSHVYLPLARTSSMKVPSIRRHTDTHTQTNIHRQAFVNTHNQTHASIFTPHAPSLTLSNILTHFSILAHYSSSLFILAPLFSWNSLFIWALLILFNTSNSSCLFLKFSEHF